MEIDWIMRWIDSGG